MLTFTPSATGGLGQPARPGRTRPAAGCGNNHRNPERAGDCPCADLAAERAERAETAAAMSHPSVILVGVS